MTSHTLRAAARAVLVFGGAGSLVLPCTLVIAIHSMAGVCPLCGIALGVAVFCLLGAAVLAGYLLLEGEACVLARLESAARGPCPGGIE